MGFRDDRLCDFFVGNIRSQKIPSDLESRLFRKIQMIDDAATDQDLWAPQGEISTSTFSTSRASTVPHGRRMMMCAFAQFERVMIVERV